jgi:hypothetical protein
MRRPVAYATTVEDRPAEFAEHSRGHRHAYLYERSDCGYQDFDQALADRGRTTSLLREVSP